MRRLLIRPGAIGDFIVSLPALECLRADYLEVWTSAANVPLARFADRARSIASTGLDLLELTGPTPVLLSTLRGFDSIVSWYGASRAEFRDSVRQLGLPFQFLPALPAANAGIHAVDFYLRQVRSLADCPSCATPRILTPVAARERFAVIHPFSGSRQKCWPIARFRELAALLEKRMPVEWCAGPEEELAEAKRFGDLYELACWLATACVYVGNDSGPTHLAAAVGTPVVALFGPSNAVVWAPRGPEIAVVAGPSMESITIRQVESVVRRMLSGVR
ncbi:MAG: glycosyltransferase family 9 protein [Bryobacteraceae bacterium]